MLARAARGGMDPADAARQTVLDQRPDHAGCRAAGAVAGRDAQRDGIDAVLGMIGLDQGLARSLGRPVHRVGTKRRVFVDRRQVRPLAIGHDRREPDDPSEPMDARGLQKAGQAERLISHTRLGLSLSSIGPETPPACTIRRTPKRTIAVVPSLRIGQIVRKERDGHSLEVEIRRPGPVSRHDSDAVRHELPQHGSADQAADTGDKDSALLHSAASARRSCGRITVAIRLTSSLCPGDTFRIVKPT